MAYKDILVYLDPTSATQDRLRLAVAMAQAHGARLTGVDASSEAALGGAWGELASRIGPEFEAAIKEAELVGRFVGASAAFAIGGEYGHCVDLIIAPRPEGEARALVRSEIPEGTLHRLGRADVDPAGRLETVVGRREHRYRLERQPRGGARCP